MRTKPARRARPANLSTRGIGTLPWSYLVVIAICGSIIAAGFLLAARQHFVSMDLGMKNSKLRKQLDDLESENRRLMLAREVASSPIELTRTARTLGFVETGAAPSVIAVQAAFTPAPKPSTTAVTAAFTADLKATGNPTIAKTASIRPTTVVLANAASNVATVSAGSQKKADRSKVKPGKPDQNTIARR